MANAIDAMAESPEKKLTIQLQHQGNKIHVRFSDTGKGITSEDEPFLFELFSQLSNKKVFPEKHQGFGLWWVRTFLRDIGGDLRYEKPIDEKGAIFIAELPIAEENNEG